MNENKELAIAIARRFLEQRGYEIEGSALDAEWPWGFEVLAKDDDTLVFTYVKVSETNSGQLPKDDFNRAEAEGHAVEWFTAHDEARSVSARFDTVCLKLIGENRAFLRHHINIDSDYNEQEDEA